MSGMLHTTAYHDSDEQNDAYQSNNDQFSIFLAHCLLPFHLHVVTEAN